MLTWEMTQLLTCPSCRGTLTASVQRHTTLGVLDGLLECQSAHCHSSFVVRDGIPDLVPKHLFVESSWQYWKSHLDGFQRRRDLRIVEARRLASRLVHKKRGVQQAFGRFTAITEGRVLDVGCGPGKMRFSLPPSVEYFGIDPTPLREAADFPYARALAEYLPFKSGTFTDVVVLSALDHFRDLDRFFDETARVLAPHGRLHIVQTIHHSNNPIKQAAHWVKDALEDYATKEIKGDAPHHMWEWRRSSFLDAVSRSFQVVGKTEYSRSWYSPNKLFLTLARGRV